MHSATVASIILFVVAAAALNSLGLQLRAARKLAWAWTGVRRTRYLISLLFSILLAILAGAIATIGILISTRSQDNLEIVRDVCSACAQLVAGLVALLLFQQKDFVESLSVSTYLCAPFSVYTLSCILGLVLFSGTGCAIAVSVIDGLTLAHLPAYLFIAFLACTFLLSIAHLFSPPMHDERHYQLMWIILAMSQIAGVMSNLFTVVMIEQPILQSWFFASWLVGIIASLHVFTTLEPASLPPPIFTNSIALPITPRIIVHRERIISVAMSENDVSRVHKPSSPLTPTEVYMRMNDPFASPPLSSSILSHQESFDDLAFGPDKPPPLMRAIVSSNPGHGRSRSEPNGPTVPLLEMPTPRRRERRPLPEFPPELQSAALDMRHSNASSVAGEPRLRSITEEGRVWKGRFEERFYRDS